MSFRVKSLVLVSIAILFFTFEQTKAQPGEYLTSDFLAKYRLVSTHKLPLDGTKIDITIPKAVAPDDKFLIHVSGIWKLELTGRSYDFMYSYKGTQRQKHEYFFTQPHAKDRTRSENDH